MSELSISLLKWQQKCWLANERFQVIAAGRRCGKSRYAAGRLLTKALECPDKTASVFYVAETQGQARDIMWSLLLEMGQGVIKQAHINNLQITLINGVKISLKGSDRPDTMRGVSLEYLVLDEYATMKPYVWDEILSPALADREGSALFIGTPQGRNHFYELYQYAMLGKDAEWGGYHLTSYDNETLSPKEIEKAKGRMSGYAFRQEFMASFEAKSSMLFNGDDLTFVSDVPEGWVGSTYIAIDLAGFEELGKKRSSGNLDNTAIAIVSVGKQGWLVKDFIVGRWTLKETAKKIFDAVEAHKPISVGIEKGIARQAVMSPLRDMMSQRGRHFHIEDLTHGNKNKTDRIVWSLQGRFENKLVKLIEGDWQMQFIDELMQFPSPLVHDDMVDALSYIDQMVNVLYEDDIEDDTWEPLDATTGF